MNPVFDTECSSGGCESGWTLYLDHDSFPSPYNSHKSRNEYYISDEKRRKHEEDDEDDEEDLSMVSDASSGPPHFHEDEEYGNDNNMNGLFYHAPIHATSPKNNGKRQKHKELQRHKLQEQQLSLLDDTASSPIFNFSNNNLAHNKNNNQPSTETMLDYSQGHSTTHFEGKSRFQEHFGFFQSPVPGVQLQQNQWFEGRRWG